MVGAKALQAETPCGMQHLATAEQKNSNNIKEPGYTFHV
jgi:hypothetical protein